MKPGSIFATLAGTRMQLFASRAAFCPEHDTLFVADLHLGKDATFRRHGIPVPLGSSGETLQTISRLLSDTSASRLVILGDLFHARSSLTTETVAAVESFFAAHSRVEFLLVRGNHDAHVGNLPGDWPIRTVEEGERMGQLALGHHPGPVPDGADLWLCGHLHPSIRIGSGRDSFGKLPCFWYSSGCLVFPAIGEFTGTHVVQPQKDDRTWLVAESQIIEL